MNEQLLSALRRFGASACLAMAALAGMASEAQALTCPAAKVEQAGLCYDPPRAGYSCTGAACMENCRSGYEQSLPGFCHFKGSTTYTVPPYLTRKSNHPHKCGLLFYENCRADYRMDACGICSYKGAWDTTRHTYFREPGISPDFTQAFHQIASVSQATYGSSLGAMKQGYEAAVAEVNKGLDAVTLTLFKAAAKRVNDSPTGAKIRQSAKAFAALDADTVNAMRRILVLAASKANLSADEQQDIANTMVDVGRKTGLYKGAPAAASQVAELSRGEAQVQVPTSGGTGGDNGSYGIYAGAAGAYYAGAHANFGIVVNADKDSDGKLQIMIITTIGGSVGAAIHAEGMVGLTESPRGVDKTPGPQIGLSSGVETPDAGIEGAFDWSLYKGMRGAQNAVPSTSIAITLGDGIDILSLTAGNTTQLAKFAVPVN
ncbi:hypothetical protein LNV09_00650 [Paucibacter sp. B2R-40]|uniref:hypothetical protein n=1 Tax=Paucibacter sp. B2R-40 TaxID=2893554 RepID=UPI0021E3FC5D|nr:hypothetical protein [Paucibacter sp. B2R-40]MCV2352661.1 hypothetical protein [Paucibacter sp. B2R-40]